MFGPLPNRVAVFIPLVLLSLSLGGCTKSADGYGTSPHAAVIPTPRAETQGKRKAPALLELWQGIGAICSRAQLPSTLAVVDSCESRAHRAALLTLGALWARRSRATSAGW